MTADLLDAGPMVRHDPAKLGRILRDLMVRTLAERAKDLPVPRPDHD